MRNSSCSGASMLVALSALCCGSVSGQVFKYDFAYTSNRIEGQTGIYLHTKNEDRLITSAFTVAEASSWSPDGKNIAFQAKVNERWDIHVMDVDGRKSSALTNDAPGDFHPVWSPSGSTIAFYSDRSTSARIWLIESDGTNLREFPIEITGIADFSWSPDGRQVAFALTTKPGNLSEIHIHRVNLDGTGFTKLTDDPGQNLCPKWSPDSSGVLFYNQPPSSEKSRPRLVYVSTDGGRTSVVDVGKSGGYFPDVRSQSLTKR